jgi:hypothetical protein
MGSVETPTLEKPGKNGFFPLRHPEWGSAAQAMQLDCRNALFDLTLYQGVPNSISWIRGPAPRRNFLLADSLNGPSRA